MIVIQDLQQRVSEIISFRLALIIDLNDRIIQGRIN